MESKKNQSMPILVAHVNGKRYVATNDEEFTILSHRIYFNHGKRLEHNYHCQIKYSLLTRLKALLTGDNSLIDKIADADEMNTYNALEEMNERAVLRKMRQRKNHKF
jgi:hypothetical protein